MRSGAQYRTYASAHVYSHKRAANSFKAVDMQGYYDMLLSIQCMVTGFVCQLFGWTRPAHRHACTRETVS